MHVLYPIEITSSYTDITGNHTYTTETVYRPRELDMINARYGRIKLDEKAINPGKRQTYKQLEVTLNRTEMRRELDRALQREGKEPLVVNPSEMWQWLEPVFLRAGN